MGQLNELLRIPYVKFRQRQLLNSNMSVISNNCNGAVILHDLHQPFCSPFVNLWMQPNDYIKFCREYSHYLSLQIEFIKLAGINYPVGRIDDVLLYFMHYKSEEEARKKWEERSKRVNMDNLYFMLTESDGCTYENLRDFDNLPYKNKVALVHKPYSEIKCSFYIHGFENQSGLGNLLEYENPYTWRRWIDQFDYVGWFNQCLE